MEKKVLPVKTRQAHGKGAAHALRRQGLIPGVIYGKKREPAMVEVDPKALRAVLDAAGAKNVPFQLALEGGQPVTVMLKELQHSPLSRALLHADFWELTAGQRLHVNVAIHMTGTAPGVAKGGVLQQVLRELPVECLPEDIPESLTVDVSGLEIGDSIHVRDIGLPTGLKATIEAEQTAVICAHPTVAKEEVPAAEAAEGEAAAAVPAAEKS